MYRIFQEKFRKKFPVLSYRTSNIPGDVGAAPFLPHQQHIRLLSYNIQVGISTEAYRHYFTRSWQHVFPSRSRFRNLDKISSLLKQYDIVALQECDGGSMRSGYVNQVEYLAEKSGHPFWYQQLNRNLGRLAQNSNGLLSRLQPHHISQHRLPGLLPGRGAIIAKFGYEDDPLVLVMMHLALSFKAQYQQLEHIYELIAPYKHVVLMGDLNNRAEQLLTQTPLKHSNLLPLPTAVHTFPSWRPERTLDHILVSPGLQIRNAGVVCFPMSDHLPISVDIAMPVNYHRQKSL
jgi:endonuclease/exonuclease/phosphatase family metal-dependent hydrolase